MQHLKKALFAALLAVSATAAQAIEVNGSAGDAYQHIDGNASMLGIDFSADWTHNDHKGEVGGVGIGIKLPVPVVDIALGGKAVYLSPTDMDTEYAAALGGRFTVPLGEHFAMYGSAYYAPDGFASGNVKTFTDAAIGVRWNIIKPVSIDVGYRYTAIDRDNGGEIRIADGVYGGLGVRF
ncbi:membrane protein [Jeongeupia sp. HS-3]|uniref:YfaZ family outer membrane protein n=1 Tax=Jeongeupia sp. HS-3 TaxID=1009682 RepID=UPI0018A409AE|nr:YfaZ family outer membrane protein [Jeongeupia sp. HS-3]BCL76082.1 membrane protein [Jeongeupia sp. HS-3]